MDSQVPRKRPQWTSKDWWQEVLCEEADGEKAMDPMRLSSAVLYHKKPLQQSSLNTQSPPPSMIMKNLIED